MTTSQTSRRAVLAGLAIVPTISLPAVLEAAAEPDPIYAAIEAHRAAEAHYSDVCLASGKMSRSDARLPDAEAESAAASDAAFDAATALTSTTPTMRAGLNCAVALRHRARRERQHRA